MATPQRGILRPRKTKADLELRTAIIGTITKLQGGGTLSALADDLGVSAKTLSRYCNPNLIKPVTLGGDVLFRICELCDERDITVTCRGRVLRLAKERSHELSPGPEQLRFVFTGKIDIDIPARKGMMTVDRVVADGELKVG